MPRALPKPSAETRSVVELIHLMISGRIRVPVYQRDLQWDANDVRDLLDSIYRGFPIGSLLFHNRPAPAGVLNLGPLVVKAPETNSAFDVVDGQQRLVALAATLARPEPIPTTPDDPYVVYFDPREEAFRAPPKDGQVPDTWVPLPALADGSRTSEWVFNWAHAQDKELRARVFEAGTRLREYKVPLYSVTVELGDTDVLRELFYRVNAAGKPLKWEVVHDALYGSRRDAPTPSTTREVAQALADLGLGRPDETEVLRCLIAYEGHDVTRSYKELERDNPRFLDGTAAAALPTLRRVLSFLRDHAEIPHLRLLPWTAPLTVLTRFFRLHPEPRARSLELLTWWLWRGFLAMEQVDWRTLQRRGISQIDKSDEEASVQGLLALVPEIDSSAYQLPSRFDARAAQTRLALLGMVSLAPRDLATARPIDVAALIEESDLEAFRRVVAKGRLAESPANRVILPGSGLARAQLSEPWWDSEIMRSHGINQAACAALRGGDVETFIRERENELLVALRALAVRLTGWKRPTRPSIDYLLRSADK